jgi:serine/threonine-protein kinase
MTVGVLDRGEYDDQLWITMDYVPGFNAAELLDQSYRAGMPATKVAQIIIAVGRALDYAHDKGLLHRDVKPANIMIGEPNEREQRVLLADFGVARRISEISGLTATNMTVGTVAYAAPEQLMGDEIDGRADQYALAATAYHLLTGSQLFPHSNPAVVIGRHLNASPPLLAAARPELAALDPTLAVALAKEPADRFNRCADFANAFTEALGAESLGPNAPTMPAHVKQSSNTTPIAGKTNSNGWIRRGLRPTGSIRPWLPPTAVVVILLAVIAAVSFWRPWQPRNTVSSEPTPTTPATSASALPPPARTETTTPSSPTTTPTTKDVPSSTISVPTPKTSANTSAVDGQFLSGVGAINNPSLSTLIDAAPNVVTETGRSVCTMLDQGFEGQAVKGMVLDRLAMYGESRTYYAGLFAVYAVQSYCPEHQADSGFNGNY